MNLRPPGLQGGDVGCDGFLWEMCQSPNWPGRAGLLCEFLNPLYWYIGNLAQGFGNSRSDVSRGVLQPFHERVKSDSPKVLECVECFLTNFRSRICKRLDENLCGFFGSVTSDSPCTGAPQKKWLSGVLKDGTQKIKSRRCVRLSQGYDGLQSHLLISIVIQNGAELFFGTVSNHFTEVSFRLHANIGIFFPVFCQHSDNTLKLSGFCQPGESATGETNGALT